MEKLDPERKERAERTKIDKRLQAVAVRALLHAATQAIRRGAIQVPWDTLAGYSQAGRDQDARAQLELKIQEMQTVVDNLLAENAALMARVMELEGR